MKKKGPAKRPAAQHPVRIKRVYEPPCPDDGLRVLVDRIWPRGLTREAASADLWLQDAAPSHTLRRWYGHDLRRWERFRERYRAELARQPDLLHLLDDVRRRTALTLLFGAVNPTHNNAVVLREVLEERSAETTNVPELV